MSVSIGAPTPHAPFTHIARDLVATERRSVTMLFPSRVAYFSTARRGQKVFASAKASNASSRSCASTVSHVG